MENDQSNIINTQLLTLPASLQEAIRLIPWKDLASEIGSDYNLTPAETTSLEQETLLVVYGFEPIANYLENIVSNIGIKEEIAIDIAEDINDEVFEQIADKARELETIPTNTTFPEIAPEVHPMVEEGEVAHDVPLPEERGAVQAESSVATPAPTAQPEPTPAPKSMEVENKSDQPAPPSLKSSYPGGVDPYREPLE